MTKNRPLGLEILGAVAFWAAFFGVWSIVL